MSIHACILLALYYAQLLFAMPLAPPINLQSISLSTGSIAERPPLLANLNSTHVSNISADDLTFGRLTSWNWKVSITQAFYLLEDLAPSVHLYNVESCMTRYVGQPDPRWLSTFKVIGYDPDAPKNISNRLEARGQLDFSTGLAQWTVPEVGAWPSSVDEPRALFWPPDHDVFEADACLYGEVEWNCVEYIKDGELNLYKFYAGLENPPTKKMTAAALPSKLPISDTEQ